MATYVILSRFSPDAMCDPNEFQQLAETVSQRLKTDCPRVRWNASYAVMGRFDVVDIVEADTPADVERAAMIIRSQGQAATETMHATPWKEFLANLASG